MREFILKSIARSVLHWLAISSLHEPSLAPRSNRLGTLTMSKTDMTEKLTNSWADGNSWSEQYAIPSWRWELREIRHRLLDISSCSSHHINARSQELRYRFTIPAFWGPIEFAQILTNRAFIARDWTWKSSQKSSDNCNHNTSSQSRILFWMMTATKSRFRPVWSASSKICHPRLTIFVQFISSTHFGPGSWPPSEFRCCFDDYQAWTRELRHLCWRSRLRCCFAEYDSCIQPLRPKHKSKLRLS